MKVTKRKRSKTQEKQLMQMKTIAHHHQTDAQAVPKQWPQGQLSALVYMLSIVHKASDILFVSWGWLFCLFPLPASSATQS